MINIDCITRIINEGFSMRGFFVVDISISTKKQINIFVDNTSGITIKECVEVTRYIRNALENEIEDYDIQVSSPGLDKAFKVIEQYRKNIGKQVEVVKIDGFKITGTLNAISDEFIELEEKVKIKSKNNEEKRSFKIGFSEIKTTKEVIKIN